MQQVLSKYHSTLGLPLFCGLILLSAAGFSDEKAVATEGTAPRVDSLALGDSLAPSVFGTSFEVKSFDLLKNPGGFVLVLEFQDGSIPEVQFSEKFKYGRKSILLKLENTVLAGVNPPPWTIPYSHLVVEKYRQRNLPGLSVGLSLPGKVEVSLSSKESRLELSIPYEEKVITAEPHSLKEIVYQVIDEHTLAAKIEMGSVPFTKKLFLMDSNMRAVLFFNNTRLVDSLFPPPEMPNLKGFQSLVGETAQGIPFVKLIFESRSKIVIRAREESHRYFLDLMTAVRSDSAYQRSEEDMLRTLTEGTVAPFDPEETSYLEILKRENPEAYRQYVEEEEQKKKPGGLFFLGWLIFFVGAGVLAMWAAG